MAAFIAKQMVGNQLKSVKDKFGGGDKEETKEPTEEAVGEDPEVIAARLEAEERRKEKHRQMEEERETMRQGIRDKYGLKKKEEAEIKLLDEGGRIGRKKKTPAEMSEEQKAEEEDDELFSKLPTNLTELQTTVSKIPSKIAGSVGEMSDKCVLQ